MKHIWIENKDFKPADNHLKDYKCERCGMEKRLFKFKENGEWRTDELFQRSGITFGFASGTKKIPECLDWNDNTLD